MMKQLVPLSAALLLAPLAALHAADPPRKRPNIIFVMPDDLGYGDYACLGNPIMRTPAVDAVQEGGPAVHALSCQPDLFADAGRR